MRMPSRSRDARGARVFASMMLLAAVALLVIPAPAAEQARPAGPRRMAVVICFDTEDYVTPPSERIDDIPRWLAETMTEEGVRGTFFVIGEKARSLERRGRVDVIRAMARHEIGSHTNAGSVHPTVTESLEKAGWDDGVGRMVQREAPGFADLRRIFGQPIRTLARHGGSYGAQLVAALGAEDRSYVGSPADGPGRGVVWFCNALNFPREIAGFDDYYYRDDLFDPVFQKLKAELAEAAKTTDVVELFAGHPTKIRAEEFWDLNFYGGVNTPPWEWKVPRLRPIEAMATARKNFRRLVRYLRTRPELQVTTYGALMDAYARQKETMTAAELRDVARRSLDGGTPAMSDDFSPAEAFSALAKAVSQRGRTGSLPAEVRPDRPLGPPDPPPAQPGVARLSLKEIEALAYDFDIHVKTTGNLPGSLPAELGRVGAGSLFALFCAVYLDADAGALRDAYGVPGFSPYPTTYEKDIVERVRGYKTWPVHRPDLDMERIVEMTRLQLWTLKPARRAPAAGAVPGEGR